MGTDESHHEGPQNEESSHDHTTTTTGTSAHEHDDPHARPRVGGSPAAACGARAGRWGGGRGGWGGGGACPGAPSGRAILVALRDEPAHGYEVMRRLEEMSGGLWRPSPGSVYPHLQMLEDEGLVQSCRAVDGSRIFTLTEAGRAEAEQGLAPLAGRRREPTRGPHAALGVRHSS